MPTPQQHVDGTVIVANAKRQLVTIAIRNAVGVFEAVRLEPGASTPPVAADALGPYTLQLARLGHVTIRSA